MRLSFVSESPLRRAWLPMAAVAARNSAPDAARDLHADSLPISIATRMRITRFCASVSVAKRAAVSRLTGMTGGVMVFMASVYGICRKCKGGRNNRWTNATAMRKHKVGKFRADEVIK